MSVAFILFFYFIGRFALAMYRHVHIENIDLRLADNSIYDEYQRILFAYGALLIGYLIVVLELHTLRIKVLKQITDIIKNRKLPTPNINF